MNTLIIDILLLIGVVYLFSSCNSNSNSVNADYEIVHYVDTVNNHVILTTVCDGGYARLSVSTLELNDN